MNRPWVIWSVLIGCALLIVGAIAVFTENIVEMEREGIQADAEAEIEERVRLALSRMDAAASGVLVVENQRPPVHFEAFYSPDDILTNAYQKLGKELIVRPSPLLSQQPEFIRLHFEIRPGQVLSSPQVPSGNQRDLAEASGISQEVLNRCAGDLNTLRTMLAQFCPMPGVEAGTNFDMLALACAPTASLWNTIQVGQVAQVEQKIVSLNEQRLAVGNNARKQKGYQDDFNYIDQGKRAQVFEEAQEKAAKDATYKVDWGQKRAGAARDLLPTDGKADEATPFRPVWLGSELFAVRRVVDEHGPRFQGMWLQALGLENHLLKSVSDLLPSADLAPVEALVVKSLEGAFDVGVATLESEPRAMVTLPWRLEPGETALIVPTVWSPLRVSLLLGWIAVVVALFAAAGLVRGVLKMSERRAAFVSSVTHELRTPLTTFQLYSDMLADGMVKEEDKRQGYLNTLRLEAGRLNHLIENVLAYSRIERGSARTKHERLSVVRLLERFESRVAQRVEQERGELIVRYEDGCEGSELNTDVTAVEQIIFNLVDNACKYGMPEGGNRTVLLRSEVVGRKARFAVCDEGCGIERKDLRRLFRPFHKSAKDAADTKPGVGLGLALSRRLARALGGDLIVEKGEEDGACFVLELPVER